MHESSEALRQQFMIYFSQKQVDLLFTFWIVTNQNSIVQRIRRTYSQTVGTMMSLW